MQIIDSPPLRTTSISQSARETLCENFDQTVADTTTQQVLETDPRILSYVSLTWPNAWRNSPEATIERPTIRASNEEAAQQSKKSVQFNERNSTRLFRVDSTEFLSPSRCTTTQLPNIILSHSSADDDDDDADLLNRSTHRTMDTNQSATSFTSASVVTLSVPKTPIRFTANQGRNKEERSKSNTTSINNESQVCTCYICSSKTFTYSYELAIHIWQS